MSDGRGEADGLLETTIPSYLTAWPSRDLLVAGHQQLTKEWWRHSRPRYDVVVSDVVMAGISLGDREAATERLKKVRDLPQLVTIQVTDNAAAYR